jgi:hypothetical protein
MQAEPSEFMAAARRYAIAGYDRTGLARTLAIRPVLGSLIAVLTAVLLAAFMYTAHGPMAPGSLDLFGFIPAELVHNLGIAVLAVVLLAGLAGVASMALALARSGGVGWRSFVGSRSAMGRSLRALWQAVGVESLIQRRYRTDCDTDGAVAEAANPTSGSPERLSWYRRTWFIHAAAMWGFLGLLAATILDYGLDVVGLRETGTPVPVWYPVRLLGTLAGLLLLYGTSMLIVRRWRGEERSVRHSTVSDWLFLLLLWTSGVTGFGLEIALYLPDGPAWGYWLFLVHVAVAMELVLLAPFTKFAHAAYRPVALFFLALAEGPGRSPKKGARE